MTLLFTYLLSATVHATEAFYQPGAQTSAATVQAGYRSGRADETTDGDDSDDQASTVSGLYRLGLRYEYSFNERLSFGIDAAYSDLRFKSQGPANVTGFEPIDLYLRGNSPVSGVDLLYGVDVTFAVENAKFSSQGFPNRSIGDGSDGLNNELTVRPTLGVQSAAGNHHYGLLASYDVYKADQEPSIPVSNGTLTVDLKRGARSSLLGFYEFARPDFLVGLKVDWIKQWELKVSSQYGSNLVAGYGMLHLEAYGRYALTPSLFVRPSVTCYTRALSNDDDVLDDWRWSLAVRQTF